MPALAPEPALPKPCQGWDSYGPKHHFSFPPSYLLIPSFSAWPGRLQTLLCIWQEAVTFPTGHLEGPQGQTELFPEWEHCCREGCRCLGARGETALSPSPLPTSLGPPCWATAAITHPEALWLQCPASHGTRGDMRGASTVAPEPGDSSEGATNSHRREGGEEDLAGGGEGGLRRYPSTLKR